MSEAVYIETSALGHLTARSTKNLILAANTEITKDLWESRRNASILYTSEAVLDEVAQGDTAISAQVHGIAALSIAYRTKLFLPEKNSAEDVVIALVNYLLDELAA